MFESTRLYIEMSGICTGPGEWGFEKQPNYEGSFLDLGRANSPVVWRGRSERGNLLVCCVSISFQARRQATAHALNQALAPYATQMVGNRKYPDLLADATEPYRVRRRYLSRAWRSYHPHRHWKETTDAYFSRLNTESSCLRAVSSMPYASNRETAYLNSG